ncbi:unnamed protein product, partial [Discosporangium mesarthrocarpum]
YGEGGNQSPQKFVEGGRGGKVHGKEMMTMLGSSPVGLAEEDQGSAREIGMTGIMMGKGEAVGREWAAIHSVNPGPACASSDALIADFEGRGKEKISLLK